MTTNMTMNDPKPFLASASKQGIADETSPTFTISPDASERSPANVVTSAPERMAVPAATAVAPS